MANTGPPNPTGSPPTCYDPPQFTQHTITPMTYFAIVKIDDDGQPEIMDGYDDYDAADAVLDGYCERYPNAYIDIVEMAAS